MSKHSSCIRPFFMIFLVLLFIFVTSPYTTGQVMAQSNQAQEQLALLTEGCCDSPQNLTDAIALLRNFSAQYPELGPIADGLENASSIEDLTSVMDLVGNFTEKYAPEAGEQVGTMRDLVGIINATSSINISEPGGLEELSNIVNNNLTSIIDTVAPPPITTLAIREKADPDALSVAPGEAKTITYEIEVINGIHPLEDAIAAELLFPGTVFISASNPYIASEDVNGTTVVFDIGHMDPKETRVFTVTINVTGTSGFQALSKGAIAKGWDMVDSKVVSSGPDPLIVAPVSLQQYLAPTIDAQSDNPEISNLAAGMSDDPQAIFQFVRDQIEYDPYYGSMRGALGTYWGGSGSSEDQANLLVALLRSAHIPARYVVGEVDDATALKIIDGMFDYPSVVLGYVPEEQRYNPVNDIELINTVKKHTWVEVYDGSDWIPLDPTIPDSEYGSLPYVPVNINGTYSELPDSLRYKMTIKLEVERASLFGWKNYEYPLNYTAYVSELTDTPITFTEFAIRTTVFFFGTEQFEPTLTVGNTTVNATYKFDTLLEALVSKRLIFEVIKPDGTTEEYEHPLLNIHPNYEIISMGWGSSTGIAMSEFAGFYVSNYKTSSIDFVKDFQKFSSYISDLNLSDTSEIPLNELGNAFYMMGKSHFIRADQNTQLLDNTLLFKSYISSPRVVATGMDFRGQNLTMYVNLVNNRINAIPFGGQSREFLKEYMLLNGLTETIIEDAVLGNQGISTPEVFVKATSQNVPILTLKNQPEDLQTLSSLPYSQEAKARMVSALYEGDEVVVPEEPVNVDGKEYTRWYTIDSAGFTIDNDPNGRHTVTEFVIGVKGATYRGFNFIIDHLALTALLVEILIYIWKHAYIEIAKSLILEALQLAAFYAIKDNIISAFNRAEVLGYTWLLNQLASYLKWVTGVEMALIIMSLILAVDFIRGDPPAKLTFLKALNNDLSIELEGGDPWLDSILIQRHKNINIIHGTISNPLARVIYLTNSSFVYSDWV